MNRFIRSYGILNFRIAKPYRPYIKTTKSRASQVRWYIFILVLCSISSVWANGALNTGIKFNKLFPVLEQPWYFSSPSGVAIDDDNNVYIADTKNHCIKKFTSQGKLISKWGNEGDDPGQFNFPRGIAIGEKGNIYVADTGNIRIQKFTSSGSFILKWKFYGLNDGEGDGAGDFGGDFGGGDGDGLSFTKINFRNHDNESIAKIKWIESYSAEIVDIAIDSKGIVYAVDKANNRIQKFGHDGTFIEEWGIPSPIVYKPTVYCKFFDPSGIAIDQSDNVYVIEEGEERIQILSNKGSQLFEWNNFCTQNVPPKLTGIAVDNKSHVYVSDKNNKCIYKFSPDGSCLFSFGYENSGKLVIDTTTNLAIGNSGNIYITGSNNNSIQLYSNSGQFISKWTSNGIENGMFNKPQKIALNHTGEIYVADANNDRIQHFTSDGEFIKSWGTSGQNKGEFLSPHDIAIDSYENVYIVDTFNHRVQKFNSDGIFLLEWGHQGSLEGEFFKPTGIEIDKYNNVYVVDKNNHRIQKFNSNGEFISQWGQEGIEDGELNFPTDVAIDVDNNVYVLDKDNFRIQKFTADGMFQSKWGIKGKEKGQLSYSFAMDIDDDNNIYIADSLNDRIQKFNAQGQCIDIFGENGTNPGQFSLPQGIAIGKDKKIYVGDTNNHRIQILSQSSSNTKISKVIIVAGGGNYSGNNLWDSTQFVANFSYRALNYQGYTKDFIYYLTSDLDLDLDDNKILDDVDGDVTKTNIEKSIKDWAIDADELIMYITNHGGDKNFRVNETELLQAEELNEWLDHLQSLTGAKVILVYDACQSGSFLPVLSNTQYNRIFIASTSSDQQAYFTSMGQISFSYYFWNNIFNGMSLYDSYLASKDAIEFSYSNQTPLLNADGNSIGNESSDMDLIEGITIGNGTISAGDLPFIGTTSNNIILNGKNETDFFADNVISVSGISKVWAIITPPNYGTADPSSPVLNLPEIQLSNTSDDLYEGSYDGFMRKGTYNVAFFAKDQNEILSIPKNISVTQTVEPDYSILSSTLKMNIPCLEFQGTCYNITLDQYTNPSDGLNLFWKLDINSTSINQSCSSDCASLDNTDFSITVSKIKYMGNFYQIILSFYFNSDDPTGYYWKLDLNSVKAL